MPEKPAAEINALTSLRFFAAFMILLYHNKRAIPIDSLPGWLIHHCGFMPVGFFFVLSGSILIYRYSHPLNEEQRVDFWIARLSRIYPVYLPSLLLMAPALLCAPGRIPSYWPVPALLA